MKQMMRFKTPISSSLALIAMVAQATATPAEKPGATPGDTAIQLATVVNVAELAGRKTKFQVRKSAVENYQQALPGITADHGAVTISIGPRELITLVSED